MTSWITQYPEDPHVTTEPCQALNLATLLPVGEGEPSHNYKEILEVYASRPVLRDLPIPDPDLILYTNGTSLMKQGQRLLGYAVVTEETIVEASSLPSHWCAQWAELYSLIWALQLSKGKKTNIYTGSRYAFAILYIHRALYKERGLLTASGKDIKNKEEILTLLDAAWEPERGLQSYTAKDIKKRIPPPPGSGKQTDR